MSKKIEDLLFESINISRKARDLAENIYNLKKIDSNIIDVKFSINPYLKGKIEMKQPFKSVEEFEIYLVKHKIPFDGLFDDESNLIFSFGIDSQTPDAFYGEFYKLS